MPYYQHKLINRLQALMLILAMATLLTLAVELLFGTNTLLLVFLMVSMMLLLAPRYTPTMILGLYGARPLASHEVPDLYRLIEMLARRAQLSRMPRLYYIPSAMPNAFAVGDREDAALALTDGILRRLDLRELGGVLAHELSHIHNNDVRLMGLADIIGHLTRLLSLLGQILLLINLPLYLLYDLNLPWAGLLLLVFAPSISALLQLALSRSREFNADLEAARISGDPEGLASALLRLEQQQTGLLSRLLLPGRHNPQPSMLRSHPDTRERVRRLLEMRDAQASRPVRTSGRLPLRHWPEVTRAPRHYIIRPWH